ncbi:sensor histidine kinase [Sunxiuqinia sp. A32]|uniref:sensor histidine kinase n=1 Tax=Sunxiuqinia sp. A32 TaxID=3461496 RepID=UPI004046140E
MRHPFINSRILILYYAIFWVAIGAANALIQIFWSNMELTKAFLESMVNFLLYPVLGASIWFIVKYNGVKESDWLWTGLYHLIGATILNAIWLYLSFMLIKMIDESHLSLMYSDLPSRVLAGYVLYMVYVVFFYAVNYYQTLKEKVKREAELKTLVREAELSALKSQINPHFLFNSLNSISSLTISNPTKAQEMVINLSNFMRYSLQHDQEETVSLEKELENIKLYLSIEKIRFGKKLNPVFNIEDACLQAQIPNMILQPLFENAIKYGVYEATGPVGITTSCKNKDGYALIIIDNEYEVDSIKNKGEGIGLRNIRQRLDLIYGNPDLLKIMDKKTSFRVELAIPQKK